MTCDRRGSGTCWGSAPCSGGTSSWRYNEGCLDMIRDGNAADFKVQYRVTHHVVPWLRRYQMLRSARSIKY